MKKFFREKVVTCRAITFQLFFFFYCQIVLFSTPPNAAKMFHSSLSSPGYSDVGGWWWCRRGRGVATLINNIHAITENVCFWCGFDVTRFFSRCNSDAWGEKTFEKFFTIYLLRGGKVGKWKILPRTGERLCMIIFIKHFCHVNMYFI